MPTIGKIMLTVFIAGSICLTLITTDSAPILASHAAKQKEYICPPCGQACDTRSFEQPGTCPVCGMPLTEKPGPANQGMPQSAPTSVANWQHELDEIVKDLRLLHPNPFTKRGNLSFLREAEALKAALPTLTEEQRVVRAMRLVASIGDGHTQLEPHNSAFAWWYPIRLYEFTDGYFVTSAHQSVADLAGAQILEIAGHPVAQVVAEARKLMGADNEFDSKERLFAVHSAGLMKGLGYATSTGELKITCKLNSGQIVERMLTPGKSAVPNNDYFQWAYRMEAFGPPFGSAADWISAYERLSAGAFSVTNKSRPPHLMFSGPYVARSMPEQSAYYIQLNQVDDTGFIPFLQKAMQEVDRLQPRRLIIDCRHNFGGDGSIVALMVQEFVKRADKKTWGDLYLLTGRKTFSAAIMALNAFLKQTECTIVGEPAGAPLNFYGDAASRDYPQTGLHLYVSTLRHQLGASDDLSEFIRVDVPALFSFADYAAGRDPAVDPILRGEEMRSIPVIALKDGGAAARKAYEDRQARFAKYDWWAPPGEFDLRQACRALTDQKRLAEALETCKLNVEIHPDIWNVYYNLATVQRLAGLREEVNESLRRVLELDPGNHNGPMIRRTLALTFKPAVIRYGATVPEIESALKGACQSRQTRQINPPFLTEVKDKQMQIDCDGFPFLGKSRWAEFVFRDNSLEMVWIMTSAAEESAILRTMSNIFGAPTERNDKYAAFPVNRTALRLDRPEVLFYSDKLASYVEPWFAKPGNTTPAPK